MNGIRSRKGHRLKWLMAAFLCLAVLITPFSDDSRAEEYKFEIGEIEKKPYHLGGYAEVNPILFGLDRDSRLYRLKFYNRDEGEMKEYFSFVDRGYDAFLSTGKDTLLKKAQKLTEGRYGKMNPMKNYLYLRISQKEPFDILYFTPAITWIFNADDWSYSVSPELLYTGITNLELRLKGTVLIGDEFSEFGEKQNDYRIELRARYYF